MKHCFQGDFLFRVIFSLSSLIIDFLCRSKDEEFPPLKILSILTGHLSSTAAGKGYKRTSAAGFDHLL